MIYEEHSRHENISEQHIYCSFTLFLLKHSGITKTHKVTLNQKTSACSKCHYGKIRKKQLYYRLPFQLSQTDY